MQAARLGLVHQHGSHRGVLLVEFLDVPWGLTRERIDGSRRRPLF